MRSVLKLRHEHYLDHGWEKIPDALLYDEHAALKWLTDFDLCLYPGLNAREFNITDVDDKLTIQYDKNQPRRFPATELYFHK